MKFWQIRNQAKDSVEILIYESIGKDIWSNEGIAAKEFAADLKELKNIKNLIVRINSPGGSVFEGLAIYNLLLAHPAKKTIYIDGIAASIASVIAMAGDTIIMPENAMMMIHNPTGFVVGTAEDLRKMAETLDKVKASIKTAYRRTELPDEEIDSMMKEETWLTAQEAIEKGFADELIPAIKIAAHFDFQNFGYKKPPLLNTVQNKKEEKRMTYEELKANHPDLFERIMNECRSEISDQIQKARTEGAEAERQRILAVKAQLLPGHEDLIDTLMFDGITTGEQAAIKVLAAEKELRAKALKDFRSDSVQVPVTDSEATQAKTMKRKDFKNLTPDKQAAFIKNGGKVTD